MSLILDALKKSEAERQRQSGPTLLEVRISKPRHRYPTWVIAVGALLALNIVLLLAFVLHRPATPAAGSPQTPTGTATSGAAASGDPSPGAAAPGAAPPAAAAPNPAAAAPLTAPAVAPMAADAALAPGTLVPVAPGLGAASSVGVDADTMEPEPGSASQAGDTQGRAHNPADDEPALPPGTQDRNIPNFSEVSGDLPDLRLDLHVYAEHVRDRYALINMHRVHEGDTLPEGPRVLAITRAGVVLQYHGQDFTLRPQ